MLPRINVRSPFSPPFPSRSSSSSSSEHFKSRGNKRSFGWSVGKGRTPSPPPAPFCLVPLRLRPRGLTVDVCALHRVDDDGDTPFQSRGRWTHPRTLFTGPRWRRARARLPPRSNDLPLLPASSAISLFAFVSRWLFLSPFIFSSPKRPARARALICIEHLSPVPPSSCSVPSFLSSFLLFVARAGSSSSSFSPAGARVNHHRHCRARGGKKI